MLLAGGGTGGHLFPAVAIAEQLLRQDSGAEVQFVGTAKGIEARLIPQLGYALELVDMVGVVGRGLKGALEMVPKLVRSLGQSLAILKKFQPDIVVGVGGYASVPVLLASKLKGVPFILHEQNACAGLSNRILSRFARRVCLSIPGSGGGMAAEKLVVTGNPLRQDLLTVDQALPAAGHLLVFGGSRGARAINELLVESLPLLRAAGCKTKIVHQTGEADYAMVAAAYQAAGETNVEVVPFIANMAAAYGDARLVVCRAGATTIAELCACGRPAIMIPFPFAAADHQTANAAAMQQAGAARMLVQSDTSAAGFTRLVMELLGNKAQLEEMAAKALSLAQKDAAERVVNICQQIVDKG